MSKVSNNSNYNKVSVKTDSIVEMIQELSKLGVFKEKRKPRAKRATTADIRQEGDIGPGYTQPTQIRVEADTQALTQNQLEDIQRKNDALIASLRAEVEQQRQEDLAGIGYGFRTFRSGKAPGAYDPFMQSTTVEEIPDIIEERFGQTLNIGGPEAVEKRQTTVFAEEEGDLPPGIAFAEIGEEPRIKIRGPIREKTGGGRLGKEDIENRKKTARTYGAGWPPPNTSSDIDDIREYYSALSLSSQEDIDESILNNKSKMVAQIRRLLDIIIA
jgi:hypothetical protein